MLLTLAAAASGGTPLYWIDLGLKPGIDLGFFTLRYYSLAYLAGILLGYWHLTRMIRSPGAPLAQRHADDLFFYCTLGIILGGRLGYATFYAPELWMHPAELLKLWNGGMSFHGGLAGTVLAVAWVSWRGGLSFLRVIDYIAVCVPFGMLFGRIANFINGELWGRVAGEGVAWAMVFPDAGPLPRHPSQLYEAALEGALLIVAMLLLFWKSRARFRPGLLAGSFTAGIGLARFGVEFFREPDAQLSEFAMRTGMSMGQWLTLPLIALGLLVAIRALARPPLGSGTAAGVTGGDRQPEPLAAIFERLIANHGPISLQHYMGEANTRYYASRDPLGEGGDFITAPEISQMFGELIGLWLADIWIRAGREEPVHYVELGPGRGTLARDALRAAKRYGLEPRVHLVESSTALKDIQLAAVPQAQWHHDLSSVPPYGPILLVANEFLDALPVRQLVMTPEGWRECMVECRQGRFVLAAGHRPMDAAVPEARRDAEAGTVLETCPGAAAIVYETAGRLVEQGGAALLIDYGHDQPRAGSTLQAVREHRMVDPFATPGEADLTAHVDFAALAPIAQSRGAKWLGTVTQGRWLRELGIETRADNLAAFAPEHAGAIHSARERLIGEGQMGALFKVMGLAAPGWPDGAGF